MNDRITPTLKVLCIIMAIVAAILLLAGCKTGYGPDFTHPDVKEFNAIWRKALAMDPLTETEVKRFEELDKRINGEQSQMFMLTERGYK